MISPRPSLSATTSIISTSSSEEETSEDEVVSVPTQTTVSVGSIVVQPEATMPGVLLGTLNNTYVNLLVNPGSRVGDIRPEDLNDLVTDAVKINSETVRSFIPSDINSSSNKLTGTKEDVEGLSRRWCYLITALVTLSLITLLGTAVLSLTSWRTSQGSALATAPTPATQATIERLSAEEKYFAGVDGSPAIVGRNEWVAQPRKWSVKNTLPVRRVVVADTTTDPCGTPAECVETVRTMQMVDIEQHHQPDIRDNFLIGGDGKVYWGRGFDSQGNYTARYNNGSIGVAFIGSFALDGPTGVMVMTLQKLLDAGVRAGKISGDYALLARCQLVPGASVGSGLLRTVTAWPHYGHTAPYSCSSLV